MLTGGMMARLFSQWIIGWYVLFRFILLYSVLAVLVSPLFVFKMVGLSGFVMVVCVTLGGLLWAPYCCYLAAKVSGYLWLERSRSRV